MQCDPQTIDSYLLGRMTDDEASQFEGHLNVCESCCHRLQDTAADATWWGDAQRFLKNATLSLDSNHSEWDAELGNGNEPSCRAELAHDFLAPTDDPRMLGRIGAYEVAGVVGQGGMGIVLKGFDPALNRYVAVKVLSPNLATSGAARHRFAREAQAAAAIVHENVIAIHGVSEHRGLPYLVMPYVRGTSLQRRLNEAGPLEVLEILRIAVQCTAGLAAAHAQGLVHRDIKPANILLSDGVERIKITDFGLARAVDDASLTRTGVVSGTPQFMSPEQANGETVDCRSDLFSLGSVLYMMCTGRPPFRADTSLAVLRRIADASPRPIRELNPEIPDWLCRIVEKLHGKLPENRYASADELQGLLERCLAHQQNQNVALPTSLLTREKRRSVGWRRSVIGAVIVMLLTIAVGAAYHASKRGVSSPRTPSSAKSETSPMVEQPESVDTEPIHNWDDDVDDAISDFARSLGELEKRSHDLFP